MKKLLCGLGLLIGGGLASSVSAQVAAADTSLAPALAATRQPYVQATKTESRLLSGTEYVNYGRPNSVGHQFFESAIAQLGSLVYDGQTFTGVPLLYDLKIDQLILPDPTHDTNLKLLAEKVRTFSLGDHRFVRLVAADTAANAAAPTGFYEVLLEASGHGVALLARHTKREVQEPTGGRLVFDYQARTRLLVQQAATLTEVENLKSILHLLPGQKPALQKFARSNHLQFRGDHRAAAAVALLRYYNTLVP